MHGASDTHDANHTRDEACTLLRVTPMLYAGAHLPATARSSSPGRRTEYSAVAMA